MTSKYASGLYEYCRYEQDGMSIEPHGASSPPAIPEEITRATQAHEDELKREREQKISIHKLLGNTRVYFRERLPYVDLTNLPAGEDLEQSLFDIIDMIEEMTDIHSLLANIRAAEILGQTTVVVDAVDD